jgi:hypothetical protein
MLSSAWLRGRERGVPCRLSAARLETKEHVPFLRFLAEIGKFGSRTASPSGTESSFFPPPNRLFKGAVNPESSRGRIGFPPQVAAPETAGVLVPWGQEPPRPKRETEGGLRVCSEIVLPLHELREKCFLLALKIASDPSSRCRQLALRLTPPFHRSAEICSRRENSWSLPFRRGFDIAVLLEEERAGNLRADDSLANGIPIPA